MNTIRAAGRILLCALAGSTVLLLDASAQSSRPGMGSIPYSNGVTFRVWAPNATTVSVTGDFNGWGQTPLVKEGTNGHWSADVTGAQVGQSYRFRVNSTNKKDPRARRVTNSNGNSIIYEPNAFNWGSTPIPMPWRNDVVYYQMHVGTFGGNNPPTTFDQAIARLDHVKGLGINAIKLMPFSEFPGGRSWGYNPADLFAIESDYGGPDALKRFVRAAHERGIAVIADVVHNHYGPSDLHMWRFDGWFQNNLGGIYFYNDGRANTPWGDTRPDFGRPEVRQFIRDHTFMLVEEYRIGGFRWDSVYNIINSNLGQNPQGRQMLQDINLELSQTYPHVLRGAEDNAFDFSMNFEHQWDVGYRWGLHGQVTQSADANRNMNTVAGLLNGWPGLQRVVFSEAHDYIARNHNRSRIPSEIDTGNPESIFARKRSLLAAGIVMTTPGVPMIFQGQEFLETLAFHDDTALRWTRTNTFAGIVRAYRDLIHTRRNLRDGMNGLKGSGINVHHIDNSNKVVGYIRWNAGGQSDDVMVVANFSATVRTSNTYAIQFPSTGVWYSHFNSDSTNYAADFANIGPDQVTASGSPPTANVNMGMYAIQIFSKTPPGAPPPPPPPPVDSFVTFDPEEPVGCEPIVVTFDVGDGPLKGATNVLMHVGKNGWQYPSSVPMASVDIGIWSATVQVELVTTELNMVFHNGSGIWDNNAEQDWMMPIPGCYLPSGEVELDPPFPQGCVPVTITYDATESDLAGVDQVFLEVGHNNWLNVKTLAMTNIGVNSWTITYDLPPGSWQLDFAFHDDGDERVWDNNNFENWSVFITGCFGQQNAMLSISDPDSDIITAYDDAGIDISGEAVNLAGDLEWINVSTGDTGLIPATEAWSIANIPLYVGPNLIRVSGSSDTVNLNDGAEDSATNELYVSMGTWTNGQNGGQGWGGGWTLSIQGNAGHFLATTNAANLSMSTRGWGLWANSGGISEALRPFADHLHPGDVLTVRFDNNWIDNGGSVGISLQNTLGQTLFEFLFIGGTTNYIINDAITARNTGLAWSGVGLVLTFELLSPTEYRFTADSMEMTGTLAASSEALISRIRTWNASAGPGWERNLYILGMEINGEPLEGEELTAERTVHRRYGPHFYFGEHDEPGWRLTFPQTEIGYIYEVYMNTNLLDEAWTPLGLQHYGNGIPLQIIMTNGHPSLNIRTGIQPVE